MRPQALSCFATLPPLQSSWSFIEGLVVRDGMSFGRSGKASVRRCVDPRVQGRGKSFVFDDVNVDFRNMQLRREGSVVPLTPQEFKILKFMVQNAERVFSRDELLNEVGGCHDSDSHRSIDNYILRLRQKLELDPADAVHFRTVHGCGYMFVP
jgi:DNA-binding response OmpR family regulator